MKEELPRKEEIKFVVNGQLDKSIRTTKDYWDKIVENKHPTIKGKESEVKKAIKAPEQIRKSKSDPNVYLYYRALGKHVLCVVAKHLNDEGFIVTSYITDIIKEGEKIWEK